MLGKIDTKKTLQDFAKAYNLFIDAQSKMEAHKELVAKFGKDKSIRTVTNIAFHEWGMLYQNRLEQNKKLLKQTKKLIVLLLANRSFGKDLFEDYKVDIEIKYQNAHHHYLR